MVCYLSLGTNLGDRESNLRRAVSLINKRAGRVLRQSHYLETDPQGFVSENKFLNACIAVDTDLSPGELLAATQAVEREMGRTQKSIAGKYSDRIIDIDILLYGNERIRRDGLEVPHPRMRERDFVMRPLSEILK